MNIIKNIKNLQNEHYSKTSSHNLIGDAKENDIVKLIPNIKSALVKKINCINNIELLYNTELNILDFVIDRYNNFYITGFFNKNTSTNDCTDVFLAKMYDGKIINMNFVPGIKNDKACNIILDNFNNAYICGYFTDSITFNTIYLTADYNNKNMFIAKINTISWEWIWANYATSLNDDFNSKCQFIRYYNNSLYAIGYFNKEIIFNTIPKKHIKTNGTNIFIIKINSHNGDLIWINNTKTDDYIKATDFSIHNNLLYIIGNLQGNIYFDKNLISVDNQNFFITTYNLNGEHIWIKNSTGTKSSAKKFKIDNNNNIYILGEYNKSFSFDNHTIFTDINNSDNGAYILKFNNNVEWIYNIQTNKNIILFDIEIDIYNFLYIIGKFNKNIILENNTFYDNEKSFIIKLTNNKKLISFNTINAIFNTCKLYYSKELYIGGIVNNNYKIFIYHFDDRNEKCLGIIRTPNTSENGDLIDIDFSGNLSFGYKNLSPGYNYFIQDDGSIGTNYNKYYFGTALTSDKLLIK